MLVRLLFWMFRIIATPQEAADRVTNTQCSPILLD